MARSIAILTLTLALTADQAFAQIEPAMKGAANADEWNQTDADFVISAEKITHYATQETYNSTRLVSSFDFNDARIGYSLTHDTDGMFVVLRVTLASRAKAAYVTLLDMGFSPAEAFDIVADYDVSIVDSGGSSD